MSKTRVHNSVATERGVARLKMFIDGQWRSGANERDVCDPYRGERVACAPESSLQDLDDAPMRDMTEERLVLFNL